jgi:hypothetical protein
MEELNLIWCVRSQYEVDFSWNWICEIFSNFSIKHHYDIDNRFDKVLDNSIIIVCVKREPNPNLIEYIEKFNNQDKNYSILHLSDEALDQNVDFYSVSKRIIRNYFCKEYSEKFNVMTIPLGYQSGIKRVEINKSLFFNFVGQMKSDREIMLRIFSQISNNYIYLTRQWGDPNGLNVQNFSQVLSSSLYTLCPRGWICLDSFRINEALECGSIPVSVLDSNGEDYFEKVYGLHPFVIGKDWQDAFDKVVRIDHKSKFEEINLWWSFYKQNLKDKLKKFIKK